MAYFFLNLLIKMQLIYKLFFTKANFRLNKQINLNLNLLFNIILHHVNVSTNTKLKINISVKLPALSNYVSIFYIDLKSIYFSYTDK